MSKLPKPVKSFDKSKVKRARKVAEFFKWKTENKGRKVKDYIGDSNLEELEEEMEKIKKEEK